MFLMLAVLCVHAEDEQPKNGKKKIIGTKDLIVTHVSNQKY